MESKYVDLNLRFEKEGDVWVGHCLELGTSTFYDALEDCQEAMQELAVEHLDLLEELGERANFFKEWGDNAPLRARRAARAVRHSRSRRFLGGVVPRIARRPRDVYEDENLLRQRQGKGNWRAREPAPSGAGALILAFSHQWLNGVMFVVGGTAPSGAGALTLALSHQGRGDSLVEIRAWFR